MRPTPRRWVPALIALVIAAISVVSFGGRRAPAVAQSRADYVIFAGAAGLRWDDLSPSATPALWRLAQDGTIGALSVRSARSMTCPSDGWLTLGAGAPAVRTVEPVGPVCPGPTATITSPDGIGAHLADQAAVIRRNQELSWDARPGVLAEAVRCTVAVGPGAAIAAARPVGRVDRYVAELPAKPAKLLNRCVLSIVDLGTVAGSGIRRAAALRRVDAMAARLVAARPPHSLLMVAGLADTDQTARLHVAIADGPGFTGGWLSSASTSRTGYLQLIDLAPTALAALGKPHPAKLFAGFPAHRAGDRPASLAQAVRRLDDADLAAGAQHRLVGRFFTVLVVVEAFLLLLTIPLLRRARQGSGPYPPRPVPRWLRRLAETALVAAALTLPAALAAGMLPWWRSSSPGWAFTAALGGVLALVTILTVVSPLRRHTLGPTLVAATVVAVVFALDVISGARLQLNGVAGYSALTGDRYSGLGTVALGALCAGALLATGCVAQQVPRRWRPVAVALLGGAAVVLVGNPYLGADAAGAIALTAGVCLAAALSTGGWLTLTRLAWAAFIGVVVTTGFAVVDLHRPAEQQGSLGRFLAAVGDGTAGLLMHQATAADVRAALTSPLSFLAVGTAFYAFFVLLPHWGGLRRLFGIYPAVRAAVVGLSVAAVAGGLLNGAGLIVAGAAAAISLPLITLAALRAQAHADERTVASGEADPADTSCPPTLPSNQVLL